MTKNCKTGLTSAFTAKIYFRILGLDLGLGSVALALVLVLHVSGWLWPWPCLLALALALLTGLGLGLDTSGLVNIPDWGLCSFCGELGPHLTKCRLGPGLPPYQVAS